MAKYWFRDMWNYVSLLMYFVFGITLVFKVRFFLISLAYVNASSDPVDKQKAVIDFEALGWIYSQIWNWTALNSVLVWARAFRFLKYANDSVAHLSYSIFDSATPLVIFFTCFWGMNFAYGVSFHIAFGVDVGGHIRGVTGGMGTLPSAVFTQWRMLLKGGNNFDEIITANRLLGPLLLLTYGIVGVFIATKIPSAILNKTYSVISDHGSDDPMAKQFRSILLRNIKRFFMKVFFKGKKDDDEIFRLEREQEYEAALNKRKPRRKQAKDAEDIELINRNFHKIEKIVKEFHRTVTPMKDKVEEFVRVELEKHQKEEAKYIEPPSTLLFGRKEAWGQPGAGYENKPDMSSCIQMMGNKTILPPNWKLYHSEEGEPFYYNILDDTVQWDPPVVMRAAVPPEIEEEDETPKKDKKRQKRNV